MDGDAVEVAIEYGTSGCDPVVMAAVNLTGMRVGAALARTVWRWRERSAR